MSSCILSSHTRFGFLICYSPGTTIVADVLPGPIPERDQFSPAPPGQHPWAPIPEHLGGAGRRRHSGHPGAEHDKFQKQPFRAEPGIKLLDQYKFLQGTESFRCSTIYLLLRSTSATNFWFVPSRRQRNVGIARRWWSDWCDRGWCVKYAASRVTPRAAVTCRLFAQYLQIKVTFVFPSYEY